MGWNIVNAGIALASVVCAAIAAWVSILVYRRQIDIGSPDVSATVEGSILTITVDNSTSFEWDVHELRMGRGIRANLTERLGELNGYGEVVPLSDAEIDALLLENVVPIGYSIYPKSAGSSGALGRRDRKWVTIRFSTSRKSVRLKLILVSREGRPRKTIVPINRMVAGDHPARV